MSELTREFIQTLKQPLEEGRISVWKHPLRADLPARFLLVGAVNPCPCGHLGDPRHSCLCPPPLIERYRARISGPLLDRIDLHVEVPAVSLRELRSGPGEPTRIVAERVAAARLIQQERFGPAASTPVNAAMGPEDLRRWCTVDDAGRSMLDHSFEKLGLSARALDRILKVARTIADLGGSETIRSSHLAEAIQYRSLDRWVAV